jgi:hypothetical protein
MGPDLENAIHEISLRMRLLRAMQEDDFYSENLTERDFMIIDLLNEKYPPILPNSGMIKKWFQKQSVQKISE